LLGGLLGAAAPAVPSVVAGAVGGAVDASGAEGVDAVCGCETGFDGETSLDPVGATCSDCGLPASLPMGVSGTGVDESLLEMPELSGEAPVEL